MDKKDYEEKEYVCCWCGNKFKRRIVKGIQQYGEMGNETYSITSQVKCRKCGGFIKT